MHVGDPELEIPYTLPADKQAEKDHTPRLPIRGALTLAGEFPFSLLSGIPFPLAYSTAGKQRTK